MPALKMLQTSAYDKVYSDGTQNQKQVVGLAKTVEDQASQKKQQVPAFGGQYIIQGQKDWQKYKNK